MLEVSRDAAAVGEEQLVSCAAEQIELLYLYSNPCLLRRFTFHELGSLAVSSRRR